MNELRQQPDASRESGRRPAARHLVQPIAVDDALYYLAAAATADIAVSRSWDIGGPNVLRYQDMMRDFAEEAGLARRRLIPVPLISPTIGSRGVAFLTPLPLDLVRPLVESLRYDAVLKDRDIDTVIPPPPSGLRTYRSSIREALRSPSAENPNAATLLATDPSWAHHGRSDSRRLAR